MSDHALVIAVTLHGPRYHGQPEWPPAPARLFQALVAGAGPRLDEPAIRDALGWLETLAPPTVAAPRSRLGQEVQFWVPNNDLDAHGGNPDLVEKLRVAKSVRPRWLGSPKLLEAPRFLYVWRFEGDTEHLAPLASVAERVFQLGRGVDMAAASAALCSPEEARQMLFEFDGEVFRPTEGWGDPRLLVPRKGTLKSLMERHHELLHRHRWHGEGKQRQRIFVQPRKPLLREVGYADDRHQYVFELRDSTALDRFIAWPLERAYDLVVAVRDAAVARLMEAGVEEDLVRSVLVGPRPGEFAQIESTRRARVGVLPSVTADAAMAQRSGSSHVDQDIRRVVLEVPPNAPLDADDLRWAFAGLAVERLTLIEDPGRAMLRHFAAQATSFRSITPVALPVTRRRIEPTRKSEEAKSSHERRSEESDARSAVCQALRHAQIAARPTSIWVQREPFEANGRRAEAFASQPRFPKERLWHIEVSFDQPIRGPLTIGDGRFLGLGLLRPLTHTRPDSPNDDDVDIETGDEDPTNSDLDAESDPSVS